MIGKLLLSLTCCCALQAATPADLLGPVASSPWSYYTVDSTALADEIPAALLDYLPTGTAEAACTFTMNNVSPVTLTGTCASNFSTSEQILIGWNPAGETTGSGRMWAHVSSIAGNVITTDIGGLVATISGTTLTGLTVYHCTRCEATVSPYYDSPNWVLNSFWNAAGSTAGNNYYDASLALYRMYMRTGDSAYLTSFRTYTDTWFVWALNSGGMTEVAVPRSTSLFSQFVRAADGGLTNRFDAFYAMLYNNFTYGQYKYPQGMDNREPGYTMMNMAVGALLDPDSSHHTDYCSWTADLAQAWVHQYNAYGLHYFPEKASGYPYTAFGMAPWRNFSVLQGLARAYDALVDCGGHSTLAADVLAVLVDTVPVHYSLGYDSSNRGIYYDVQYPADGLTANDVIGLQPGTVGISGTSVTGVGTSFNSGSHPFTAGVDYIGIVDDQGAAWTYPVATVTDDTHLTIGVAINTQYVYSSTSSGSTQNFPSLGGTGRSYFYVPPYSTSCDSTATYCPVSGDINNNRDLVWIMGWMYNTTHDASYKTMGDELFAVASGGPADGTGGSLACSGPACSDVETDFGKGIHACTVSPTLPCSTDNYTGGNAYQYRVKRWAQFSGIGGADQYLGWRDSVGATNKSPGGGLRFGGGMRF